MLPNHSKKLHAEEEIKQKLAILQANKNLWPRVSAGERVEILDRIIRSFVQVSHPLVNASLKAKGITDSHSPTGEEWTLGPYSVLRYLRLLRQAHIDIQKYGAPRFTGSMKTLAGNQLAVLVFPRTFYDRLFFKGLSADVWLEPGLTPDEFQARQKALIEADDSGKLAVILSAGNATSMPAMDALYKLFVENHVVLVKTHPIQKFLNPFLEQGFQALIQAGVLALVEGGADTGAYLCQQPEVDEIHIVGSHDTFNKIASSMGETGVIKRITAELECVSPFIIVPGDWSDADVEYQAEHIVSSFVINAGFDCTTPRVLIQHASWGYREKLLDRIRYLLGRVPPRLAYYPKAAERHNAFIQTHPEAEQFGDVSGEQLPWTLVSHLDPRSTSEICFKNEAFCSLYAETGIEACSIPEYLEKAVEFANRQLFGDLSATIVVHPSTLKDPGAAEALEKAVKDLKCGSVSVNYWAGAVYPVGSTPWGSFSAGRCGEVRSGIGFVNNALMLPNAQKTVMHAPFRARPKPIWFSSQYRKAQRVFPLLAELEASTTLLKVPRILANAI